jgi:hypothetical protein
MERSVIVFTGLSFAAAYLIAALAARFAALVVFMACWSPPWPAG